MNRKGSDGSQGLGLARRRGAALAKVRKKPSTRQPPSPARIRLRRKPRNVPLFWQMVRTGNSPGSRDLRTLGLILEAGSIPWLTAGNGALYVPALYARKAEFEIGAFGLENRPVRLPDPPRPYPNAPWMLGLLLLLLGWNGVVFHWWPNTDQWLSTEAWKRAGSLDVFRVTVLGEWWRCITALTLHADSLHLFANVFAGCVFLPLLGRLIGLGPSLLLIMISGGLGNALNALYRPLSHASLGFSTALFACVGLAAAVYSVRRTGKGRVLLPLAAGVGILASLGAGDFQDRTDYAAHIFGLLAGMLTGAVYGRAWLHKPGPTWLFRTGCLILGLFLPILCWFLALDAVAA